MGDFIALSPLSELYSVNLQYYICEYIDIIYIYHIFNHIHIYINTRVGIKMWTAFQSSKFLLIFIEYKVIIDIILNSKILDFSTENFLSPYPKP